MSWFIIRHGNKEQGDFYNQELKHRDQPLSSKGFRQSRELSAFLQDKGISRVFVSSYICPNQTIEYFARQQGLVPTVDPRLNEIDNGLIDGMSQQDIQKNYPEMWKAFIERKTDFRFPEGETGVEAQNRIVRFFKEKQEEFKTQNIVIVSHDGMIRLLACFILGLLVYKRGLFKVDTCGIMEVDFQETFQEWRLVRFNQSNPD